MNDEHEDDEEIDSKHDLAHELAERLLSCIDAFVMEKGASEACLPVILLATEIPASVSRRLCRDAGMLKEGVNNLRGQASQCALGFYDERARVAKTDSIESLGAFIIRSDQSLKH